MVSIGTIPIPNPAVVSRLIKDEAVLVLPVRGQVKVLNEVGARIWFLIDGIRTTGDIAAIIEAEYAVGSEEALNDVRIFLAQLAERQIITLPEEISSL
jgi:hypothetical protein